MAAGSLSECLPDKQGHLIRIGRLILKSRFVTAYKCEMRRSVPKDLIRGDRLASALVYGIRLSKADGWASRAQESSAAFAIICLGNYRERIITQARKSASLVTKSDPASMDVVGS